MSCSARRSTPGFPPADTPGRSPERVTLSPKRVNTLPCPCPAGTSTRSSCSASWQVTQHEPRRTSGENRVMGGEVCALSRCKSARCPTSTGHLEVIMMELREVPTQRAAAEPLTRRERVILSNLNEDITLEQIATRLFVTRNTVKSQVRSVYKKLGVSTRADAVACARAFGLR